MTSRFQTCGAVRCDRRVARAAGRAQALTKQVYEGLPARRRRSSSTRSSTPTRSTSSRTARRSTSATRSGSRPPPSTTWTSRPAGKNAGEPARSDGDERRGSDDAAGTPYWFNGCRTSASTRPHRAARRRSTTTRSRRPRARAASSRYTGKKGVATPIPFGDNPKPLTVKFAKAGTVKYFCDLHPGMEGLIHVLPKSRTIPSAKADAKACRPRSTATSRSRSRSRSRRRRPARSTSARPAATASSTSASARQDDGAASGRRSSSRSPRWPTSRHTATTGPGGPIDDPTSYLGMHRGVVLLGQFVPQGIYPSDRSGRWAP